MNYVFLENRRDSRKCLGVAGALLAGFGSMVGGATQYDAQMKTNQANRDIAAENNASQERIANAANQLQVDMMRENNAWSAKQAELAFQREADYNSAQAQVQRYLDAGLNPAIMMQNSGATSASASAPSAAGSTVHPNMPNFVTPTMVAPPSILLNAVESISKLASSYSQMKSGEKLSKETSWLDRLNESTVKNLTADALGKEAKAKFDNIMAQLNSEWMPKEAKARIEKMFAETTAAYARGEFDTANAMYTKLLEQFKQKELDILNEKAPFLVQEVKETVNLIKQKQQTEKSAQSANYASAKDSLSHVDVNKADADYKRALKGLTDEQKSQLEDMHEANVRLRKIQAGQAAVDFQFLHGTMEVRKNLLVQSGKLNEQQLQNMEQAYKRAVKENNLFYVNWFLERCDATCRDIGYIAPWKIGSPAEIETNPYGFSEPSSTGF